MDGQVYVKVQADTSTYSTRAAGSEGSSTISFTINWSFNGGISGNHGWDSPRKVNPVEGNVEATNAAVAEAYKNASFSDLMVIGNCVTSN